MNVFLSELLVVCLLGALHSAANAQPEDTSADELQPVRRRFAESTIASEISKLMDSMVQKNFVDFLLNQKEKRSKPAAAAAEKRLYNELLKLSLQQRQQRNI